MFSKELSANDRKHTSFAQTITELKVTFVTAVTVKQQRVLLQQGNWQCGDGQHMECEVLTDSGQSVQCEVLTDSVQTAQYEVMTESGRTLEDSSGHSDTEQTDCTV